MSKYQILRAPPDSEREPSQTQLKVCLAILATTLSASCSSFTNDHNDESRNVDYRELCGEYVAEEFPIVETSLTQPNRDLSEIWPGNYSIRFNSERSAVALIDQFQGCLAIFESDNAVIAKSICLESQLLFWVGAQCTAL